MSIGSYVLLDLKWGGTAPGTPGGAVTFSFADSDGVASSGTHDGIPLGDDETAMTQARFREAVTAAFAAWSAVADIDFTYLPGTGLADISLFWEPLPGPTLAITSFDGADGVFDHARIYVDSLSYDPSGPAGSDFYLTVLHEIGHALGLDHVGDDTQLMFANENPGITGIGHGDAAGAQRLYGPALGAHVFEEIGTDAGEVIDRSAALLPVAIRGAGGNDRLAGGASGDILAGGSGSDMIDAGGGNDRIFDGFDLGAGHGGSGNDIIVTARGNGGLWGDSGDDVLLGGLGADGLFGGSGNDVLMGDGAGGIFGSADRLVPGPGRDHVMGGPGADRFVFAPGEGTNTIGAITLETLFDGSVEIHGRDFTPGEDVVELDGFAFANRDAVVAALGSGPKGAVLVAEGTVVEFHGVSVAELEASDFILS